MSPDRDGRMRGRTSGMTPAREAGANLDSSHRNALGMTPARMNLLRVPLHTILNKSEDHRAASAWPMKGLVGSKASGKAGNLQAMEKPL